MSWFPWLRVGEIEDQRTTRKLEYEPKAVWGKTLNRLIENEKVQINNILNREGDINRDVVDPNNR